MLTKLNQQLDKVIEFCLSTKTDLGRFSDRTKVEIKRYKNKQIKKTAAVCFGTGIVLGFLLKAMVF